MSFYLRTTTSPCLYVSLFSLPRRPSACVILTPSVSTSLYLRATHSPCLYIPLPLYPSACVPLTLPTSVPLRDSLFASTLQRGEGPPPNALQAVMAGWGPGNLQVFVSIYLSIYQSIYIPYTR